MTARDRVVDTLRRHKLLHSSDTSQPTTFEAMQLGKIVVFESDLASDNLGLVGHQYESLRVEVTDVIHCAWTMNYNMKLRSFENLIRGSANLINLCLSSARFNPATFHFTSSIAAAPPPGGPVLEALYTRPDLVGSGYAQSKYVVESLCNRAVQSCARLKVSIHRLGYLVGSRTLGQWSKGEEYPLVVQSLAKINYLPTRPQERLSLLPVDDAAKACVQLMFTTDAALTNLRVFNVAHPQLIEWNGVFLDGVRDVIPDFLTEPVVAWVARLKAADPGYRLLSYFESAYGNNDVPTAITTTVARRCSPHLAACAAIDVALMSRVGYRPICSCCRRSLVRTLTSMTRNIVGCCLSVFLWGRAQFVPWLLSRLNLW